MSSVDNQSVWWTYFETFVRPFAFVTDSTAEANADYRTVLFFAYDVSWLEVCLYFEKNGRIKNISRSLRYRRTFFLYDFLVTCERRVRENGGQDGFRTSCQTTVDRRVYPASHALYVPL